ncbi:MAG: cyanophycin synthetase, partial [Pacificimonas sp.]
LTLIDESYNANAASMRAALSVLGSIPTEGRRVAILGAMGELGDLSAEMHHGLAEPIRAAGADPVLLVGDAMTPLADEINAPIVSNVDAAKAWLQDEVRAGDTLLLKGSNSVGLSALVAMMVEGQL